MGPNLQIAGARKHQGPARLPSGAGPKQNGTPGALEPAPEGHACFHKHADQDKALPGACTEHRRAHQASAIRIGGGKLEPNPSHENAGEKCELPEPCAMLNFPPECVFRRRKPV